MGDEQTVGEEVTHVEARRKREDTEKNLLRAFALKKFLYFLLPVAPW
jgi:hypothetical protein